MHSVIDDSTLPLLCCSGIHIIAVDGSQAEVTVEVVGGHTDDYGSVSQNLTLVLTSPREHVTWTISTSRISGQIAVVLVSACLQSSAGECMLTE